MIAQDMVAVRLTPPFQATMVVAPGDLAGRPVPASIHELDAHHCIGFRLLASRAIYGCVIIDID